MYIYMYISTRITSFRLELEKNSDKTLLSWCGWFVFFLFRLRFLFIFLLKIIYESESELPHDRAHGSNSSGPEVPAHPGISVVIFCSKGKKRKGG